MCSSDLGARARARARGRERGCAREGRRNPNPSRNLVGIFDRDPNTSRNLVGIFVAAFDQGEITAPVHQAVTMSG